MTQIIQDRWQVRRYLTAAVAASVNEVLLQGELGIELDTGLGKFGDGVTHYNDLLYRFIGDIDLTGLADGKMLLRKEDADGKRWIVTDVPVVLPSGGTTGQVLTKASNTDQDADWEDPSGSSSSRVAWNPDDCSNAGILCNSDSVFTYAPQSASGSIMVRANKSFSTGKHYFEVHVNEAGASVFGHVGLTTAAASLNASVGGGGGWSYYEQTGQKNRAGTFSTFGSAWNTTNARLGVAFDLDAGMVWFAKDGVWQASGDPASGTNPAFSDLSGTVFPAVSGYGSNGPTLRGIFRASLFAYAPPTGFSPVDTLA